MISSVTFWQFVFSLFVSVSSVSGLSVPFTWRRGLHSSFKAACASSSASVKNILSSVTGATQLFYKMCFFSQRKSISTSLSEGCPLFLFPLFNRGFRFVCLFFVDILSPPVLSRCSKPCSLLLCSVKPAIP